MADSLPLLLALELLEDSEVETSDVLGEDDDITLFIAASCYMSRNLNLVRDYSEGHDTSLLSGRVQGSL